MHTLLAAPLVRNILICLIAQTHTRARCNLYLLRALLQEKETGNEVAIKLIKRPIPKPAMAVIKREIKIQADLGQGHLNIVSADEVILTKSHLGLIMEYVPGGS